jgi:hypothetical protein
MKRFGLSESTAFGMSPEVRMAAFIVDGEDQGLEFSWTMCSCSTRHELVVHGPQVRRRGPWHASAVTAADMGRRARAAVSAALRRSVMQGEARGKRKGVSTETGLRVHRRIVGMVGAAGERMSGSSACRIESERLAPPRSHLALFFT